jgi:hypothetical protein
MTTPAALRNVVTPSLNDDIVAEAIDGALRAIAVALAQLLESYSMTTRREPPLPPRSAAPMIFARSSNGAVRPAHGQEAGSGTGAVARRHHHALPSV